VDAMATGREEAAAPASLKAAQEARGARRAPLDGVETVADYGDPAAEYHALRHACGLFDRAAAGRLEMRGEDRLRFLNAQLTCDVKSLVPGAGRYGFFTSVKGRVLADATVLALDDRLWLELPAGRAGAIREHLQKYVIVDRVVIEPLAEVLPLGLVGPAAGELLAPLAPAGETWAHAAGELAGGAVRAVREGRFGVPAFSLWVPAPAAAEVFDVLLQRGAAAGVRPVGWRALEVLRVEEGRPRWGRDFGSDHFPQETGLEEEAVSYAKGCYLGQEVVARIHYRGGVNRHLRGLLFAPGTGDPLGRELRLDGRAVGTVTSAAASPLLDRSLGLAIVHRRAVPGTVVEVAGGGSAEVVELPFARPAASG